MRVKHPTVVIRSITRLAPKGLVVRSQRAERRVRVVLRWRCGRDLRSFVVAADRVLTGLPNPLEIARVRTAVTYRVVDAITEAVRQQDVVHGFLAALSIGERVVLDGRHPVAQLGGHRLEVARASELLGAEASGHLACELRDVTLLGCLDEDSLRAESLQLGCSRSAAFRIPLNPRHVPTLLR